MPDDEFSNPSSKEMMLNCAMCSRHFSSGILPNDPDLRHTEKTARVHECPHCGFTTAYNKGDYISPGP